MPDFIVTLSDAQVDAVRYLAACGKTDVPTYIQQLVKQAADNTGTGIDAKVASLGLNDPQKEARVRAILVEP